MNTDTVTDGFGRRLWFLVGQEGDRVVLPLEDVTDQGTALILLVPFIHAPSHFKNWSPRWLENPESALTLRKEHVEVQRGNSRHTLTV